MNKIELTDSTTDIIMKMSEGVIGAVVCITRVLKEGVLIDPDSGFGPFGSLLGADSLGIYGSNLYILWNDLCKQDPKLFIALFRAYQLGFISGPLLQAVSKDRARLNNDNEIDIIDLHNKVCEKLENFQK